MSGTVKLTKKRASVLARVTASGATHDSPLRLHGADYSAGCWLADNGYLGLSRGFYPAPFSEAGPEAPTHLVSIPIAGHLRIFVSAANMAEAQSKAWDAFVERGATAGDLDWTGYDAVSETTELEIEVVS